MGEELGHRSRRVHFEVAVDVFGGDPHHVPLRVVPTPVPGDLLSVVVAQAVTRPHLLISRVNLSIALCLPHHGDTQLTLPANK